jgi:hypothetical protein
MELPDAPFYRRWSFILAGVIGLAAITALLGWRGLQDANGPATPGTTLTPTTLTSAPATSAPSSLGSTSKPQDVLWEKRGRNLSSSKSPGFRAPATWRIEWSFDCANFARYGGGNFKITGRGAFDRIQIQEFDVKDSGTRTFSGGGYGYLLVDSVCRDWTVRVLPG